MNFNLQELFRHYILFQVFYDIANERNLDIQLKSDIKEIESIYYSSSQILKKHK